MERATPLIEALGGKVENAYYAFGDYDVILIAEMPDDVSMAAGAIAALAGGAVKTMKTTALMIPEDGVEAMRQAGGLEYRPPGG